MAMKSLPAKLAACACGLALAAAQQAGTRSVEGHPRVELRKCSAAGGCSQRQHDLTMDANWRWVHEVGGYENCYKGKEWVEKHCADPVKCTANCALEAVTAAEYQSTYGVKEVSGGVELKFVSHGQGGANFGSRLYMLEDAESYTMFKLKNREFSLEVDASNLPCGLNGAAYFVEMDRLGGKGKGNNHAGAKYGTGYCDAQCPHDIKFIDGEANSLNWNSTSDPPVGHFGTCCAEMDIWEANGMATAYTPHPCEIKGQRRCEGIACGDNEKGERYQGVCDKDGCDFNSYRMGEKSFYGADSSFSLNTKKPVTVVTQFLTVDGTDTGELSEIRRFYMQDGKTIPNSYATLLGPGAGNSITDQFCSAQKAAFKDTDDFHAKGALRKMGEALERGVVLVLSLWDDTKANMLWLDSAYPLDLPTTRPGVSRGPCPGGKSSTPSVLRSDASGRLREVPAPGGGGDRVHHPDRPEASGSQRLQLPHHPCAGLPPAASLPAPAPLPACTRASLPSPAPGPARASQPPPRRVPDGQGEEASLERPDVRRGLPWVVQRPERHPGGILRFRHPWREEGAVRSLAGAQLPREPPWEVPLPPLALEEVGREPRPRRLAKPGRAGCCLPPCASLPAPEPLQPPASLPPGPARASQPPPRRVPDGQGEEASLERPDVRRGLPWVVQRPERHPRGILRFRHPWREEGAVRSLAGAQLPREPPREVPLPPLALEEVGREPRPRRLAKPGRAGCCLPPCASLPAPAPLQPPASLPLRPPSPYLPPLRGNG